MILLNRVILVRLDPEDLSLSAAAQLANVEAARAKHTQAKADETRSAMLVKSGVISRREYDQDRAALDSAKALLEAMEAQARVSEHSSEYAVLLADADGVIVRTLANRAKSWRRDKPWSSWRMMAPEKP